LSNDSVPDSSDPFVRGDLTNQLQLPAAVVTPLNGADPMARRILCGALVILVFLFCGALIGAITGVQMMAVVTVLLALLILNISQFLNAASRVAS
jgi:hypothetical protein